MLQITGKVVNVFVKDGGDKYDDSNKVQLLGQLSLPNGDIKLDLFDLSCNDETAFKAVKSMMGKDIVITVTPMILRGGTIGYYVPRGSMPQAVGVSNV